MAEDDETKSVSSETTFRRDLTALADLEAALLGQVVDAASSLRKKGLYARTITVKVRDGEFRDRSRSRTLSDAVQTEKAIYAVARELLADLRAGGGVPIRLIGVALTKLSATGDETQGSLIEVAPPAESERDRALARAADRIRGKFGSGAIGPGRLVGDG